MQKFFEPLMARWGTVTAFAAEVGCPEKNAREWKRIDSIPAPWFAAVVRAAIGRGFADITADHLATLAEARRLSMGAKRKADAHAEASA